MTIMHTFQAYCMQQRHAGLMMKAPVTTQEHAAGVEAVTAGQEPTTLQAQSSPTSPRTPAQQEHPAQVLPSAPEPTPQTPAEAQE